MRISGSDYRDPNFRESVQVSESGFKSVNLIKNKTVNINDMLFMGTRS